MKHFAVFGRHTITTDFNKYPTMKKFYDEVLFDDTDKLVEFSDMTVDTYMSGYKAGVKKTIKRVIIGGIIVAVIIKIKNKEINVEIEGDQEQ